MPPSKRTEYAWRGYGSTRPHPQGQMQFPGTAAEPDFRELGGHELLTPKQHEIGERALGASVQQVEDRMGAHLDAAFAKAGERHTGSGPVHAEGQDWYDSRSGPEAKSIAAMANKHGVAYHHAAAVKATTARNISPKQENVVADQVLTQAAQGREPSDMKGSTYDKVVRSAGMHTIDPGMEPLKVPSRFPRSVREASAPGGITPAMGHSYKIPGYYQSYVYPHDERTRPAIDRHMLRAANPALSNDEVAGLQRKGGAKPTLNTNLGMAGGSPAPAHRVADEGLRRAASARGLTPAEAQTSIWHQVNPQGKDTPAPVNENQFKLF
jgi:hypothetical protein